MKPRNWLLIIAGVLLATLAISYFQGCFGPKYHSEKSDVDSLLKARDIAEAQLVSKNDSIAFINKLLVTENLKKDSVILVLKVQKEYGQKAVQASRQEIKLINQKLDSAWLAADTSSLLLNCRELQIAVVAADTKVQYLEGINNEMQTQYEGKIVNLEKQIVNKDSIIANHAHFESDMRIAMDTLATKYYKADASASKINNQNKALKIGVVAIIAIEVVRGLSKK